jgi:hypothetical protein
MTALFVAGNGKRSMGVIFLRFFLLMVFAIACHEAKRLAIQLSLFQVVRGSRL